MAFKDITRVVYDGQIKLDYKDSVHRYYARPRVNWDLPEDDPKAWGKIIYPKGTTTLLDQTLEKKGLMQWPKSVALRELFGYYGSFENDKGEKIPAGFSKDLGTIWEVKGALTPEKVLPLVESANKGWQRKQKKGADIGSVVHDAIEHFITDQPFDIAEQYLWKIKESAYETEKLRDEALAHLEIDTEMANLAFNRFKKWWLETTPVLHGTEEILYITNVVHDRDDSTCENLDFNGNCHCQDICGTYDGDISILAQNHPVFHDLGQKEIRVTADWKTSNASNNKEAAMPEGVSYQYFVQSAIYEKMRRINGYPPADDLLIVSCRKDGNFSLVYASEIGLTVGDCIAWAEAVITCYRLADKTKAGLWAHAENKELVNV